ncbi:MAG: NADH-quinone oxidoreductase subunit J [Verrucomicrobiae bacterium]|nr:NADH-quinone oxidoreductase subunit J [Verrucomicrobiae bacterium]NNJ43065.1 hypothetical protein [Akkermansiaceae bacterium]
MIALFILIPLIVLAALGAIWKARPVHAALLLALSLSLVAVLYLLLGADFLGLIQFSVYVGAVAVLIVFSLLITRPSDETKEIARRPQSILAGLICAVPVLAVLVYSVSYSIGSDEVSESSPSQFELAELGKSLFTTYAPAVMAVAVMLTAVMIGAALFARDFNQRES